MAGHVYLIGSRTFNWYKIGKSSNASIRVSELGILLPFRIEVIAVWKAENHHALERLMHEKYAKSRINGEWFHFNPAKLAAVISGMATAQVDCAQAFSNIEQDSVSHSESLASRGKVQKRLNQLSARAFAAERRVAELEALLKSLDVEKVCNPRQPQGVSEKVAD